MWLANIAIVCVLFADGIVLEKPAERLPVDRVLEVVLFTGLILAVFVLMVVGSDRKEQVRRLQRKLDNLHNDYVSMQRMYIDHINRLSTPTSPPPPDPPYASEPSIVTISSRRFLRLN